MEKCDGCIQILQEESRPGVALMRSNVSDEWISSVGWATHWVRVGGSGEKERKEVSGTLKHRAEENLCFPL